MSDEINEYIDEEGRRMTEFISYIKNPKEKKMEIVVYAPNYKYSAGLVFLELDSPIEKSYRDDKEYTCFGTMEEFTKEIVNEIEDNKSKNLPAEADFSWIE